MAIRVGRLFRRSGILIPLLVGLQAPTEIRAQEVIVPLQLSLSDPGARSMGFGGAFVGLADDATAAFANPAGLVQLLRPEVSIEGRSWSHSMPFTAGGRVEGLPSGVGIDTTVGLRTATSGYEAEGLSYVSLAYPRGTWSFALYRHQYADLGFSGETQGLYGGGSDCCQNRWFDQRMTSSLNIVNYGLSAAYRLSDKLSIGLGLAYFDASLIATGTEFRWDEDTIGSFFAPSSFLPARSVKTERLFVDDTDWTIAGGFLWRLSEDWTIGGVYRQGFEADIGTETTAGPANNLGAAPGEILFRATGIPFEFPDIYGVGFAYRHPDGRLTVSFQWDRVEYSDLPDSLRLDDQTIDDADELHLGAEYVFLGSTPIIALRLGAWLDPDHQMRATIDEPFIRAMLPAGDDETHYSAGLGVAMRRFQIDLALDFADRVDTVSLSAIYNF